MPHPNLQLIYFTLHFYNAMLPLVYVFAATAEKRVVVDGITLEVANCVSVSANGGSGHLLNHQCIGSFVGKLHIYQLQAHDL